MLDIFSGCTMAVVQVIRQLRGNYCLMQARGEKKNRLTSLQVLALTLCAIRSLKIIRLKALHCIMPGC